MKRLCYFLVLCASFWWLEYASAVDWLGDVPQGETINFCFNTLGSDGAPITIAGTPSIDVYEDGSTTQLATPGTTLTEDFDGVTGLHNIAVVASSGNSYEPGKYYSVVIAGTTPTADSVSILGRVIARFRCVEAENVAGAPAVDITYVDGSAASSSIATAADIAQAVWEYVIGTEPTAVPPTAGTTEVLDMLKYVYYYGGGFNKVNSDLTSGEGEMQYYDSGGTKRFERDVTKSGTVTTKDEVRAND